MVNGEWLIVSCGLVGGLGMVSGWSLVVGWLVVKDGKEKAQRHRGTEVQKHKRTLTF